MRAGLFGQIRVGLILSRETEGPRQVWEKTEEAEPQPSSPVTSSLTWNTKLTVCSLQRGERRLPRRTDMAGDPCLPTSIPLADVSQVSHTFHRQPIMSHLTPPTLILVL